MTGEQVACLLIGMVIFGSFLALAFHLGTIAAGGG